MCVYHMFSICVHTKIYIHIKYIYISYYIYNIFCYIQVCACSATWVMSDDSLSPHGLWGGVGWSGLPCPSPEDLPHPGVEPPSLVSPALAGWFFTTMPPEKPYCVGYKYMYKYIHVLCNKRERFILRNQLTWWGLANLMFQGRCAGWKHAEELVLKFESEGNWKPKSFFLGYLSLSSLRSSTNSMRSTRIVEDNLISQNLLSRMLVISKNTFTAASRWVLGNCLA